MLFFPTQVCNGENQSHWPLLDDCLNKFLSMCTFVAFFYGDQRKLMQIKNIRDLYEHNPRILFCLCLIEEWQEKYFHVVVRSIKEDFVFVCHIKLSKGWRVFFYKIVINFKKLQKYFIAQFIRKSQIIYPSLELMEKISR
jgi:hypothetical protein